MTTILLARHGETDWNRENRFQGHADPPLNETGRAQAVQLAEALGAESLTAVYSSPLRRALETAKIVGAQHDVEPVPVDALREVDVGSWQGLTRDEARKRYPEQFARWLDYGRGWDDGESYEEMTGRVVPALLAIAAAHRGERVLAVTHGGPIRAALAAAEQLPYAEARRRGPVIGNTFVLELDVDGGVLVARRRPDSVTT